MKQKIVLFVFVGLVSVLLSSYRSGYAAQAGGDGTGATGSSGCSCHGFSSSIATTVELDSAGVPVTTYIPGMAYTVKIAATNGTTSTLSSFGFQVAVVQSTNAGTSGAVGAGTWGSMPTNVQLTTAANSGLPMDLVEQSSRIAATSGSGGNGTTYVESIPWTAPASGTGSVVIYGVMNAVNGNGSSSGDKNNVATPVTITEGANCPASSITATGHVLKASPSGAISYQWYLNGTAIPGATFISYAATTSGAYTVAVTVNSNCISTSNAFNYSNVGINDPSLATALEVYPTLTTGKVNIRINSPVNTLTYNIYGLDGRKYNMGTIAADATNATVDMSTLSTGLYILQLENQTQSATFKIVKE